MNARVNYVHPDDDHTITIVDGVVYLVEPKNKRFKKNCATLETINDDCLFTIFGFLRTFDVLNLAATCTRLQQFTNKSIFPNMVKEVKIKMSATNVFHSCKKLEMYDLKTHFEGFGNFVKHLTLEGLDLSLSIIQPIKRDCLGFVKELLDLCPNLHTLRMVHINFMNDDDDVILYHVTSSLIKLDLVRCSGISDTWSNALKRFTKLDEINLTGLNEVTAHFFKHNLNISKLGLDCISCSESEDLTNILNQNGQNIQQLRLLCLYILSLPVYASIGTLIIDKLPELSYLVIDKICDEIASSLIHIPHLKVLEIFCGDVRINSLLRQISYCEMIEVLVIKHGEFEKEVENDLPIVFNKLRSLEWLTNAEGDVLEFFDILAKAQMPAITCFNFSLGGREHKGFLTLFASKSTLKSITINSFHTNNADRFALVLGMIEILKITPNRPFLELNMNPREFDMNQIKILNDYRYLIGLKIMNKSAVVTTFRLPYDVDADSDYDRWSI